MRYYSIVITNKDGKAPPNFQAVAGASVQGATFTSFVNGQSVPGALNIELDIPVAPFHAPAGFGLVRIWGISLQQIAQAADLNGMSIAVYGGMQKGLPLANPQQSGLLAQGTITQAFGNWEGTSQTLDLIFGASDGTAAAPANVTHNWQKGTACQDAIKSAISTAFPKCTVDVNVSSKLVLPETDVGFYGTLGEYASYLFQMSRSILGTANYVGVHVAQTGQKITVYDGTGTQQDPRQIVFQDLIGQPTWLSPNLINFKTVLRADINIGDMIKLPATVTTTTQQSLSQYRDNSVFQGTFQVNQIHHFGNFRQPDGASWVTVFDVSTVAAASSTSTPSS